MKNKETLNNINCELDKIKQDNSDIEALKIYTKILEEIERDIMDLQIVVRARIEGIL